MAFLQDEEPMVLNDEEDLKRQQAAERARERQERLRDAYVFILFCRLVQNPCKIDRVPGK